MKSLQDWDDELQNQFQQYLRQATAENWQVYAVNLNKFLEAKKSVCCTLVGGELDVSQCRYVYSYYFDDSCWDVWTNRVVMSMDKHCNKLTKRVTSCGKEY